MTDTTTAAFSIDGRTFSFRGPVATGINPGAYVSVVTIDGTEHLGQVLDLHSAPGETFANPLIEGSGTLLSEAREPFTNAHLESADPDAIAERLGTGTDPEVLPLGDLVDVPGAEAVMQAKGFGRHTFVCGQSGSGKTYALGVVLERLLHATSLPIVVLDPNSDYVNLGSLRDRSDTGLDEDDYGVTRRRHEEIAPYVRVLSEDNLKGWLSNSTLRQQATILGLDPIGDAEETDAALRIIDSLKGGPYSPSDIRARAMLQNDEASRRLALRIGNLRLEHMSVWADADHPAVVEQIGEDWRAAILDLGSIRTARERSIVSALALGVLWERRRERQPVLLVIDEAHNVCPQNPTDPNQALATETLIAMAGEGRKYGIYLVLATQRPSKIHENVLSQCDNLFLMRMNSAADVNYLETAFSAVPPALIRRSATFQLGEGLIAGKIAPDPLLFKTGRRITPEGGTDIPADWARAPA